MGVLDSVIKIRALENEQAQNTVDSFVKGIAQGQDAAKTDLLGQLEQQKTTADLAKSGLAFNGQIDPTTGLPVVGAAPESVLSTLDRTKGIDLKEMLGLQAIDAKKQADADKQALTLNKRVTEMSNALDPAKQRQGAFGMERQVLDRGERLASLIDYAQKYQAGGADSRQIEELAIGLNSMLQGGNVSAMEQVKALVPQSIIGNAAKMTEWLTNDPTGLNQQKFVDRMMETVQRETDTVKGQIRKTQFSRLSGFQDLQKNHPQEFETVLTQYGITPQEYYDWQKSGAPDISTTSKRKPAEASAMPVVGTEWTTLPNGSKIRVKK